ncbi:hypothetical protein DCO58_11225 [Helicobacter saguini]|uniref:TerB family tellurite resistance protein n=1 Tax=Helicobacter saguini TaxID=1548018 RepID=A0A347VQ04_9HELI|nr:hypothetical protein [Helicobacter saguini]MWV61135.1 hypothetical protein [Helicobacter saguini]MWV68196.1 hypothetical protein [Helicobacter saguini]MWV70340.1 hypothetical protein [Helicobacter saguini]MWV72242.1 hypothetical protein [Helicobacter saguini]TLD95288.1 hypothetical protein LS64_002750 [Helicobacter saguini]
MFLNTLSESDKTSFLELAHHLAWSSGDVSEREKAVIKSYCDEMQVQDILYDEKKFNLDETLSRISAKKDQRIITLEILALILSEHNLNLDSMYEAEKEVLNAITTHFNITPHLLNVYVEWSKTMLSLARQGESLIEL